MLRKPQIVEDGCPGLLVEYGDSIFVKKHVVRFEVDRSRRQRAMILVEFLRPSRSRTARRSNITSVITQFWECVVHDSLM